MKLGDAYVDITARTQKFDKGLKGVKGRLAGIGIGFRSLATLATGTFAAIGAASLFAVKAAAEQEEAEVKLAAVLKATGEAAGFSASELKKRASELQKMTKFGDETILNTQAILATFKQIKGTAFEEATEAILDMSTVLGTDLRTSAIQVGKALNDPIQGVTALRRSGVSFNKEQTKVIKNLVKTGRTAEAQRMILAELKNEFGGAAKAAGDTLGGAMSQLTNAMSDSWQALGKTISETLALKENIKLLTKEVEKFPERYNKFVKIVVLGAFNMRKNWIRFTSTMKEELSKTRSSLAEDWLLITSDSLTAMEKMELTWLNLNEKFERFMATGGNRIRKKFDETMKALDLRIRSSGQKPLNDLQKAFLENANKTREEMLKTGKVFLDQEKGKLDAIAKTEKERLAQIKKEKAAELKSLEDGEKAYLKFLVDKLLEEQKEREANFKRTVKGEKDLTDLTKKEVAKRTTTWFGLADFWKKIQESVFENQADRKGFIGLGLGVGVPAPVGAGGGGGARTPTLTFSPEMDKKLQKMVDEMDKQNRILKDGIPVRVAEASMAFGG